MKIGTDSMLLGAFVKANNQDEVLDIGAGTGVLSLMISQRSSQLNVTAVEIDEEAIKDLNVNFESSPFDSTYRIVHQDFLAWKTHQQFDVIVSNPPFYQNSFTTSQRDKRSKARNEENLPFQQLIEKSANLLTQDGCFWLIVPAQYHSQILAITTKNRLFLQEEICIYGKPNEWTRTIFCFSKIEKNSPIKRDFIVRKSDGNYTNEYIEMTKEYHSKAVVR